MTTHIEVARFVIRTPEDYRAAMPEVVAFDTDGCHTVKAEDDAIVVRRRVYIRRSAA